MKPPYDWTLRQEPFDTHKLEVDHSQALQREDGENHSHQPWEPGQGVISLRHHPDTDLNETSTGFPPVPLAMRTPLVVKICSGSVTPSLLQDSPQKCSRGFPCLKRRHISDICLHLQSPLLCLLGLLPSFPLLCNFFLLPISLGRCCSQQMNCSKHAYLY